MASSDKKRPNYTRRFIWLALAIVVVIAGYTAGWFYVAGMLVDRVNAEVAAINGDGRRASCENAEARGYPFRIGIFCRSVLYEDAPAGISMRAGAFRSAAQVYAPRHIIAELDGPARVQVPGVAALDIGWSVLRSSARLSEPLPERVSVEGRNVTVALDEPGPDLQPLGSAGLAELHMRPAGAGLDVAVRFVDLALEPELTGGVTLPPLDGLVDVSIADGVSLLRSDLDSLRGSGKSGTIRTFSLSLDEETGATVSGPVAIDENGLVDAELEVTLRNPQALAGILGDLMPEARREIELGLAGLAAGGDTATFPLRIAKGEISMGFLSLGTIPPI